jgi:hypothetical protein
MRWRTLVVVALTGACSPAPVVKQPESGPRSRFAAAVPPVVVVDVKLPPKTLVETTETDDARRAAWQPPSSIAELVDRGLAALRAGDADGYRDLLITNDEVLEQCSELAERFTPEGVERVHESLAKRLLECAEFDWSNAVEVERTIDPKERQRPFCGGEWTTLQDIIVQAEVPGGTLSIQLDDPMRVGRAFAFGEGPVCRQIR